MISGKGEIYFSNSKAKKKNDTQLTIEKLVDQRVVVLDDIFIKLSKVRVANVDQLVQKLKDLATEKEQKRK